MLVKNSILIFVEQKHFEWFQYKSSVPRHKDAKIKTNRANDAIFPKVPFICFTIKLLLFLVCVYRETPEKC